MRLPLIALTVIASLAGGSAMACSTGMSDTANQSTQQSSEDRRDNRRVEFVQTGN